MEYAHTLEPLIETIHIKAIAQRRQNHSIYDRVENNKQEPN